MHQKLPTSQVALAGFTLVELMVVLALFLVVFTLSNISLTGIISRNNIQEFQETVLSDINRQQNRAMSGEAVNGDQNYGLYFTNDSYTIFNGATYSANDPNNSIVELPSDLVFEAIAFPDQQVVFQSPSGEVANYDENADTLVLRNTTNSQEVQFEVNELGVVFTE